MTSPPALSIRRGEQNIIGWLAFVTRKIMGV